MLELKTIFGIIATLLFLVAYYPYLRDIFKGITQPHAYTWLIWAFTQGTAVAGIWFGKGGHGALGLAISEVFIFIVFFLSFKYGTKNITKSDTITLIGAIAAIFVWWQLDNPVLAVFMASGIDFLGYIPTYRKLWHEPWSETISSWAIFLVGDIFALLALSEYNLLTVTYLATIILCNSFFVFLCYFRRQKLQFTQ